MRPSFATRVAVAIVAWVEHRPRTVVVLAVLAIAALGFYARGLEVRADLAELLPQDSAGFRALMHQQSRAGGGATLIVIAASPSRDESERFITELGERIEGFAKARPDLVGYVEAGTRDVRAYYEANKWLYADLEELRRADDDLDHQIAIRSELVDDLLADDQGPPAPSSSQPPAGPTKPALGLGGALRDWDERIARKDTFPSGFFEARGGTLVGLRVVANVGLGGNAGDVLLREVERLAADVRRAQGLPASFEIGFTGDVASAAGEKKALVDEAVSATAIAVAVVLLAIVLYFRSPWALVVIAPPVLFGVAAAYAFARLAFGHVNAAGAFLGAIIVGNGINYPIVLLSRYQEFRSRGMAPEVARREAVVNALRAELLGACVAAIAYGSLAVTQFRGFRQFGLIGFVGMLLVWASIVPLVPAVIVLVERVRGLARKRAEPRWARRAARIALDNPRTILAVAAALAAIAIIPLPRFLADPWEYDFGKLGSRASDIRGAGEWSNKANEVFGGKTNVAGALMIADDAAQVPLLKRRILANDAADPHGSMVAEITTIDDALPGTVAEQRDKLEVLERIRSRLTPGVLARLGDDERTTAIRARPPESLRVLGPDDLPPLLRRRFTERDGRVGTVFYVKPRNEIVFADGRNHLRMSKITDNVRLDDGTVVMTASRSTIFAEMLSSLRRDGPLVSGIALVLVAFVVVVVSRDRNVAVPVLGALALGVVWLLGAAAWSGARFNYVNFIALPITFGIGCEYPFNVADRVRLLAGDVATAARRSAGPVLLCSFTTVVGYGSLLLSDFQALASFGRLCVIGELACVFAGVFVLPAALALRSRPMP